MKRRYDPFLKDIVDSIQRIEEYTESFEFEDLKENKMAVDAIVRNLEIMGEATTHIPERIKKKYSSVPWSGVKGFRDLVIHIGLLM